MIKGVIQTNISMIMRVAKGNKKYNNYVPFLEKIIAYLEHKVIPTKEVPAGEGYKKAVLWQISLMSELAIFYKLINSLVTFYCGTKA